MLSKAEAADLVEAISHLDSVAGEHYWFLSKGRMRPEEPLYSAAVYAKGVDPDHSEPLAIAEAETLRAAVALCAVRMENRR